MSSCLVFLSYAVFLLGLAASPLARQMKVSCPGCSLCSPVHHTVNGTVMEFVNAFCQFKEGLKRTSIPENLPEQISILKLSSHDIKKVETTSLQNYTFLRSLYLDDNGLRKIENGSFSRQQFLIDLDLKENELSHINAETFRGLTSLETLRLDHNKLEVILQGTFATTPLIKELDLRKNNIIVLEEGAFNRLDYLERLLLSHNNLRAINSGVLGNLMSLSKLALASNDIHSIHEDAFSCSPLIMNLLLQGNSLKTIPTKSIQSLRFLIVLDISSNPLSFIASNTFIGLKSLTTIHLNDCNISGIANNAFHGLQALKNISLKNNPLNCNCHLSWITRWLSGNPSVQINDAVCQRSSDVFGKSLTSINMQSFVCSCEDCTCNLPQTNCSCSANTTGLSCTDICQSDHHSVKRCSKFLKECYCESNVSTWNSWSKLSNCSFNITSDRCSKYGEIKKYGANLECVCKKGFSGNGLNCTDIDECGQKESNFCHDDANCINNPGSFDCKCHEGFKSGAKGYFCFDVDECKEGKPCDQHATCRNNRGSYNCLCFDGYFGNGKMCLPTKMKPLQVTATQIDSSKVLVTWILTNETLINHVTVEYKLLGTGSFKWEIIKLQPHIKETNLTDLKADSIYLLRIGVFSIFNTSIYSSETSFKISTSWRASPGKDMNTLTITVALVVGVAVLVLITFVLYAVMKQRKRQKKSTQPQYVPGLEDLIEMRTQSHSGFAEARASRDPLELGSNLHSLAMGTVDSHDEWELSRDLLVTGQKIGEGQFGLVLEGTLVTEDGAMKVAVKTVKPNSDRFDVKDLLREMEMMKEIGQHPNVVSLVGACTTPGPLYIITELASGGNLLDYLRFSRPADETYVNITSTLSSRDLLKIALDCARGMNHIALKKFVHRDLAARNVLLTKDCRAKIADFGLARDIYGDGQYVKAGAGRLPIKWMAPESIQDQVYTTMSDVWSFGVLLWEIVTIGSAPYPCVPANLILTKLLCGYRMSKPAHCSDELFNLMMFCWELHPEDRPTFPEICRTVSDMLSESSRSYVNLASSNKILESEEDAKEMDLPRCKSL